MSRKVIKFGLSDASVRKAIEELRAYKRWTRKKVDELAMRLATEGVALIRLKITEYGAIDTGALISAVSGPERLGDGRYRVSLYVDNGSGQNYALCVEYGTGSRGQNSPHPDADAEGWEYNSGPTIFTTRDGRTGWVYPTKDGRYLFTEGQPSRPFWHDATEELPRHITEIAREVFSHD